MAALPLHPRKYYPRKKNEDICIYDLRRLSFPDKDMALSELVRDYWPDRMPVVIRVTVGYCGANAEDFTFSIDEIYLVTHVKRQTRVILKDRNGQLLSFPDDHYLRFHVLSGDKIPQDSQAKPLCEILPEYSMTGGKVQLVPDCDAVIEFYSGPSHTCSMKMDLYELETTYEERYLVGNSISTDSLESSPNVIPIWMPINIDVANGIKEGTPEEFNLLLRRLTTLCKDFDNESAKGHKEIMMFKGELNDYEDYDTIEPSDYYNVDNYTQDQGQKGNHTSGQHRPPPPPPRVVEPTPKQRYDKSVPKPPNINEDDTYDDIDDDDIYDGIEDVPSPHIYGTSNRNKRENYEPVEINNTGEDNDGYVKTTKPFLTVNPNVTRQPFAKGQAARQNLKSIARRPSDHDLNKSAYPVIETAKVLGTPTLITCISSTDTTNPIDTTRKGNPPMQKKPNDHELNKPTCLVIETATVPQTPIPMARTSSTGTTYSIDTIGKDNRPWQKRPNVAQRQSSQDKISGENKPEIIIQRQSFRVKTNNIKTPESKLPQKEEEKDTSRKKMAAERQTSKDENVGATGDSSQPYQKIPPLPKPKPNIARQSSKVETTDKTAEQTSKGGSETGECQYMDISHLPKQLNKMSVQDVADCLKFLNMSGHVKRFLEETIDGQLLVCLDEQILKQDFNFKLFEAKKLSMFINGWRPK